MSNSKKRIWNLLLGFGIYGLVVLMPVSFLNRFFESFRNSIAENFRREAAESAESLLGRLEESLDKELILGNCFRKYRESCEKSVWPMIRQEKFGPEAAFEFEKHFRRNKNFPSSTKLIWFDSEGKVLQLPNHTPVPNVKGWQSLYSVLWNRNAASTADFDFARRLVQTLMGNLISTENLGRGLNKARLIMAEGRMQAFSMIRFNLQKGKERFSPGLCILLPIDALKPGWELRYAIRKLDSPTQTVGGYWNSLETGQIGKLCSPGLLNGLFGKFRDTKRRWWIEGDTLFASRIYSLNPDLTLFAGIKIRDSRGIMNFFECMRFFFGFLVLLLGVIFLAIGFGKIEFTLGLEAKYKLCTLFLTLAPLLFMTFLGLEYLGTLRKNRLAEKEQRAEKLFFEIEQKIADAFFFLEKKLSAAMNSRLKNESISSDEIQKFCLSLKPFGFQGLCLIFSSGKSFFEGWKRFEKTKGCKDIAMAFAQVVLEKANFPFEKKTFKSHVSAESDGIMQNLAKSNYNVWALNGKFDRLQGAGKPLLTYFIFGIEKGVAKSFLFLILDYEKFRDSVLKKFVAKKRISGSGRVFLKNLSEKEEEALSDLPSEISDLMLRVERTQRQEIAFFPERAQPRIMAVARILKELNIVAVAAVPFEDLHLSDSAVLKLIAALFSLAGLAVMFCFNLIRKSMLIPLLDLSEAVSHIEKGNYLFRVKTKTRDELGGVAENLERLALGLQEKSRMKTFLRSELVDRAAQFQVNPVERKFVAVSFAGIRNFSRFEREWPLEDALSLMNKFLSFCETAVKAHQGDIDKFIGDMGMAVFNDGFETPPHVRAVNAALELREKLFSWMEERERKGQPSFSFGIGIACGSVVSGSVGSLKEKKRLDFTLIGDPVNLAARLEKLAGRPGTSEILVANEIGAVPLKKGVWKLLPIDSVRGKKDQVQIWSYSE